VPLSGAGIFRRLYASQTTYNAVLLHRNATFNLRELRKISLLAPRLRRTDGATDRQRQQGAFDREGLFLDLLGECKIASEFRLAELMPAS
jgi:hypothetical protein